MSQAPNIDGVLITWGDRLFYPGNRVVKVKPQPKLNRDSARQRAAAIRERSEATVVRRAPQVMVKVTGGGRGMKAIAAHFRYISKNGGLDIEDERGEKMRGKDTLPEPADDWRFGGTLIERAFFWRCGEAKTSADATRAALFLWAALPGVPTAALRVCALTGLA